MTKVLVPLAVLAFFVGFFLLLRMLARGGAKLEAEQKARFRRARKARGTVLAIERTVPQVRNGTVIMKVRLALVGEPSGEVVGVFEVQNGRSSTVRPGEVLPIRVDADDPSLCYPSFPGAEHDETYRKLWAA